MKLYILSSNLILIILLAVGCEQNNEKLDENKHIARRFFTQVWSEGSEDVAEELVAKNYKGYMLGNPKPHDREGWFQFFYNFRHAFPDAQFTIEDMIAEGDRVALRLTMKGTHKGVFNGIEPTGRRVEVVGISIERIDDGKIVEGWVVNDALGMLQQLGVLPTTEN